MSDSTRDMADSTGQTRSFPRRYGIQRSTGYPVSTSLGGRWWRGVLFRGPSVGVLLPPYHPQVDRTQGPPR